VRVESQREEAYVRLTGAQAHYPEILRAHEAVTAWAREGGKVLIGAAREVYFSEERRPDEPFCDVAYPIA
jgi:effector-binding domain-containing protein